MRLAGQTDDLYQGNQDVDLNTLSTYLNNWGPKIVWGFKTPPRETSQRCTHAGRCALLRCACALSPARFVLVCDACARSSVHTLGHNSWQPGGDRGRAHQCSEDPREGPLQDAPLLAGLFRCSVCGTRPAATDHEEVVSRGCHTLSACRQRRIKFYRSFVAQHPAIHALEGR